MRVHELDISNGCQDHTTSPYAATFRYPFDQPCVPPIESLAKALKHRSSCALAGSLTGNPPCDPLTRPTLPRPPHPTPRFVTVMTRPSFGVGRESISN